MDEDLFFRGRLYRGTPHFYPKQEMYLARMVECFEGEEREALKRAIHIARAIPRYPEKCFGSYSRGVFFGAREIVVKGRAPLNTKHVFIPFLVVAKPELLPRFSELLEGDGLADEVALTA